MRYIGWEEYAVPSLHMVFFFSYLRDSLPCGDYVDLLGVFVSMEVIGFPGL